MTYPDRRLERIVSSKVKVNRIFKPGPFFVREQVTKPAKAIGNLQKTPSAQQDRMELNVGASKLRWEHEETNRFVRAHCLRRVRVLKGPIHAIDELSQASSSCDCVNKCGKMSSGKLPSAPFWR